MRDPWASRFAYYGQFFEIGIESRSEFWRSFANVFPKVYLDSIPISKPRPMWHSLACKQSLNFQGVIYLFLLNYLG